MSPVGAPCIFVVAESQDQLLRCLLRLVVNYECPRSCYFIPPLRIGSSVSQVPAGEAVYESGLRSTLLAPACGTVRGREGNPRIEHLRHLASSPCSKSTLCAVLLSPGIGRGA